MSFFNIARVFAFPVAWTPPRDFVVAAEAFSM